MSLKTVQSSGKVDWSCIVDDVHHIVYTFQLVIDVTEVRNFKHVDLVTVDCASTLSSHLCLLPLLSSMLANTHDVFDPRIPGQSC